MGNICRTLAMCDCFCPCDYDEEVLLKRFDSKRANRQKKQTKKSCEIFTISSDFTSSSLNQHHTSLNDYKLDKDLIDMNLLKMSNDLCKSSASVYSMDSGYDSTSSIVENNSSLNSCEIDMASINLEAISQYSHKNFETSRRLIKDFDYISYATMFNKHYLVNNSFNRMVKKVFYKQNIFSSKFISTMKGKLSKKLKSTKEGNEHQQISTKNNKIESHSLTSIYSHSSNKLRNFLSKLYDVNFF